MIKNTLFSRGNSRNAGSLQRTRREARLACEALEERQLLTMSSAEAYAWTIVNKMRQNPPQFANELEGLFRNTINGAQGYSSTDPIWTDLRETISNGSNSGNFWKALDLMRGQPSLGPLAWEDRLEDISQNHNDWMQTHCYAHSYYNTPGNSPPVCNGYLPGYNQPGINGDYDIINPDELKYPGAPSNWSTGSWGENISYSSGNSLSATRARYSAGTSGFNQRQAYADIIGFITEVNSSSLGHLKNLLSRDYMDGSGFGLAAKNKDIGTKNAIGIDFDSPNNFGNNQTNFLSTHTLSTHKQYNGEGGYIAGIAYEDKNGNNTYDVGEGVNVSWEISDGVLTTGYATTASNYGVISDYQTHNGRFELTAKAGSSVIGRKVVYINDNNVWVEFRVTSGFGLVGGGTTATMTADHYESGAGNNTATTAVPLGVEAPGRPLITATQALSIHTAGDTDWFKFEVKGAAAKASIFIGFKDSDGDLDAKLYKEVSGGSTLLEKSATSYTDDEMIETELSPGTYLLNVYGYNSAVNFYSLSVDLDLELTQIADHNGDGASEQAVFRPDQGTWFARPREGDAPQLYNTPWGLPGDVPSSGDFDGDGKADLAVFRPSNGAWYIRSAGGAIIANGMPWGLSSDVPIPADYDGDGKTDLGVFRPSNGAWYIRTMGGQIIASGTPWGLGNDTPIASDFDGDGKADLAVFRPSNGGWYVRTLSSAQILANGTPWGLSGDVPMAADLDGDGEADLAVYRPSQGRWYARTRAGQILANGTPWGLGTDIPAMADFDGDGKADLGVYRPSNGSWYVRSLAGLILEYGTAFGLAGDIPLQAPALRRLQLARR